MMIRPLELRQVIEKKEEYRFHHRDPWLKHVTTAERTVSKERRLELRAAVRAKWFAWSCIPGVVV